MKYFKNYKFYRVVADGSKKPFLTFEDATKWIKENNPKSWRIETKEERITDWYDILESSDV